jgi:hypothetical protein
MLESTPLPGLRPEEGAPSGQPIRKRGMVSICLLLFSASPFGKGGLRGISNPQIPPYPPFLKGGRRAMKKCLMPDIDNFLSMMVH